MAEQKLTSEEVNEIKSIQETQETLVTSFGELEFQIQSLEIQKDQLVEAMGQLKENEKAIGQQLNEKYGNGTINLESGTFIKE